MEEKPFISREVIRIGRLRRGRLPARFRRLVRGTLPGARAPELLSGFDDEYFVGAGQYPSNTDPMRQ